MTGAGWTAAVIVIAGILTAWLGYPAEHYLHGAALAAGVPWLLFAALRRRGDCIHRLALLPLCCAIWAGVQLLLGLTTSAHETANAATAWLAQAVILALASVGFRDDKHRSRCTSALVWFGGIYALLGLIGWYAGNGRVFWLFPTEHAETIAGTFANRDQFCVVMELLLPLAFTGVLAGGGRGALSALSAGLMFASVVATASRAGTVVVSAEALVFVCAVIRMQGKGYRKASLVLASLLICTLIGGSTTVLERFASRDPFAYRREMLSSTVAMIAERPLAGFGLGTWPSVYPRFAVFDPPGLFMNHAHNDWAEWTADGGVPMLLIMGGFAASAMFLLRRRLWALGVLAVLAHAAVDFPLQKASLACALMFVAGLAAASSTGLRRRQPAAAISDSCEY